MFLVNLGCWGADKFVLRGRFKTVQCKMNNIFNHGRSLRPPPLLKSHTFLRFSRVSTAAAQTLSCRQKWHVHEKKATRVQRRRPVCRLSVRFSSPPGRGWSSDVIFGVKLLFACFPRTPTGVNRQPPRPVQTQPETFMNLKQVETKQQHCSK